MSSVQREEYWFTGKICSKCGKDIVTNGTIIWCLDEGCPDGEGNDASILFGYRETTILGSSAGSPRKKDGSK